jgi:hypothetical protein
MAFEATDFFSGSSFDSEVLCVVVVRGMVGHLSFLRVLLSEVLPDSIVLTRGRFNSPLVVSVRDRFMDFVLTALLDWGFV